KQARPHPWASALRRKFLISLVSAGEIEPAAGRSRARCLDQAAAANRTAGEVAPKTVIAIS
ncbi:MAG: hypothetical protein AAFV86_22230, partial [Pseudomonadota bacterium]